MLRKVFEYGLKSGQMYKTIFPKSMNCKNIQNFTSSSDQSQTEVLEEVEAKIFQVLKSAAKCKQDKLSRTATFDELGFDSLDGVELVVAMEENFGIDIANEDAEKIQDVGKAIEIFNKYMVEKINSNKLSEINNE